MKDENYLMENMEKIVLFTMSISSEYNISLKGWAPDETIRILKSVNFERILSLMESLNYYQSKDYLSDGELLIAVTIIGSLVEFWIKFFYTIYIQDYFNSVKEDSRFFDCKKKKIKLPDKIKFETLKQFSRENLLKNNEKFEEWINRIQFKRNAIHTFVYREIGGTEELEYDLEMLSLLIEKIYYRLPDIPSEGDFI